MGQIPHQPRSEEHTSELQSPVVISYAVFCLKKKKVAALLRLHADRLRNAERQARLARRFTAAHPGVPVTEVYALAEDVHDLEGLREVGTLLASTKPTP